MMAGGPRIPEPRTMTPEDLTRIRWVGDPQLSPDGRRVAFVVTTLSTAEDAYLSNIWVVQTAPGSAGAPARVEATSRIEAQRATREGVTTGPRRFTTGPKRDSAPRWSPDGRWLAFVSERDPDPGQKPAPPGADKGQLYVMPADGGEPLRLTDLKGGVKDPVWAPDGRRLACTSRVGGWEEPEDPREKGKSKPARVITTLKYRLDNEGFVYDRRAHVFVVPFQGDGPGGAPHAPSGGPARQVTDGDWDDSDPCWAPDGQRLAFVSARHEGRDLDNAADVWLLDLSQDGAAPRCLTATRGPVKQPLFSPDGTQVVYLGHEHPLQSGRNMRLYVAPVAPPGGAHEGRCLTAGLDRTCAPFFGTLRPQWLSAEGAGEGAAEGGAVLFGVESEGDIPIYKVALDGESPPAPLISGQRQVTGLSAAPDGRTLVFTATDPVSPAEVYLCAADGSGERRLTDLNREWKAEVARSAPQRFRFQRAGATLDVWVMRPPGLAPGQRAPALLNIHGGPATQYGHSFFDEFQVYAGAGYAVVFANPRGSQGYGEGFSRAITRDWGNEDAADVLAALDEALRRCDFIDPRRLGVLGG
ncbi:MAG TPA: prolyl oligopeptidase family serine peptidase, partial [Chloroflexota bacterium]|nr:prolyl oligopeptidase family serine peptidase [Chloroflexota bacterium]